MQCIWWISLTVTVDTENPLSFLASAAKVHMKKKVIWTIVFLLFMSKENQWRGLYDGILIVVFHSCPKYCNISSGRKRTWDKKRPGQGNSRDGTVTICKSGGYISCTSQTPTANKNATNIIKRGGGILSLNCFSLLTYTIEVAFNLFADYKPFPALTWEIA